MSYGCKREVEKDGRDTLDVEFKTTDYVVIHGACRGAVVYLCVQE